MSKLLNASNVFLNGRNASKMYLNGNQVWTVEVPSPIPSLTPSNTPSNTPSLTPSNTPSISLTPSITPTPTPSAATFTNPTLSIGSAVQVVAQSPFIGGGNSYQFFNANSNSYIDLNASSDWALGTGDFTIEWFQYTTTTSAPPYQRVFTVDDYPDMDIGVSNEGGTFYYWANSSFRYSSASSISINTWQHWAIVRQSGTTRIYRDGTLRGSSFTDTNNINNTIDKLTIGADNGHATNATFVGYITNFRWVKGLAVYTGNFTKPTSVLTATASANPYGGSNTQSIGSGYTKLLLVP